MALVEVTVTDMVGLNERGAFAGIVAVAWALGTVLGPIIGGAIAEKTTWRWYVKPNLITNEKDLLHQYSRGDHLRRWYLLLVEAPRRPLIYSRKTQAN